MARESRSTSKKKPVLHALPLTKRNYQIIGVALACIVLGYVALAQEPWDGVLPLIVAPILLFLGYCVFVPYGILYRRREEQGGAESGTSADVARS
ncbi:MAG: hypothetical protein HY563_04140 [Ignavibacteriales bacterium]|nr:hypothetical protein [Ignavibacteriales bacterium]